MTKNADPHKYKYPGYGNAFDTRGNFSLSDCSGFVKNVIIFAADMGPSMHIDNKRKDILVLSRGQQIVYCIDCIDVDDIVDIHKYLIKKHDIK